MFAYIKDGTVIAVSENRLTKRKEPELVRETDKKTKEVSEYWKPAVPGLVFDEEIETDLEGDLEYVDGTIRKIEKLLPIPETVPELIITNVVGTDASAAEETIVTVTGSEEIPALAE